MEISHQPKIYDSNFLKLIDFLSTNLTEADEQEIQQGIEYVLRNFRQSEVKATFLKFGSIFDTFDKLKNF